MKYPEEENCQICVICGREYTCREIQEKSRCPVCGDSRRDYLWEDEPESVRQETAEPLLARYQELVDKGREVLGEDTKAEEALLHFVGVMSLRQAISSPILDPVEW